MTKKQFAELERLRGLSKENLLSMEEVAYLFNVIEELVSELKEHTRLIEAAREIKLARNERVARTNAMQEAAALAGNGGPSGAHVIVAVERMHPIVHDISQGVERIVDALNTIDAARTFQMACEPQSSEEVFREPPKFSMSDHNRPDGYPNDKGFDEAAKRTLKTREEDEKKADDFLNEMGKRLRDPKKV